MRLIFLTLLVFTAFIAQAQQTATSAQTLRLARATYEQGRLHEIPTYLNEQVIAQMNKQDKVEAYKILCLSYIYLEEPEKADQAMLNILNTDHYFDVNDAVDPAEFVALYNTFRTRPIFRIGAKLGTTFSQPNVKTYLPVAALSEGSEYKFGVGILFGGLFEIPITDKITVHAEALYLQRKFNLTLVNNRGESEAGNELKNTFEGVETQSAISIPIMVEYVLFKRSFEPFVGAGFSTDYLISSNINASRTREDASSIQESSFDFKPQRESINIGAVLTAGAKFPIRGGYIITEARFIFGLTPVNSESTAFENQRLALDYSYSDPVYTINTISVSAAYVYNVFKPKKKTKRGKK